MHACINCNSQGLISLAQLSAVSTCCLQEHAQNASAVTPEWAANLMLLLGFWCMMALDTLSHTLAPHSTHELQRESSTSPIVSCHDSSPSHYGYDCEALHEEAQLLQRPSSVAGTAANQRQKAHDSHGLSPYRGSAVSTSAVTPNGVASSAALLQDPADRVLLGLVVHAGQLRVEGCVLWHNHCTCCRGDAGQMAVAHETVLCIISVWAVSQSTW